MQEQRALVLDFGGVITRTLFETHDATERALGLPPGTLTWRGPFDPDGDALWLAMQAGRISERDYWQERTREVGALVGARWSGMADFVRAARGADPEAVIRLPAIDTIERAREAGHKLAILSNELDLFYGADFRERLPILDNFDAIIDATYTGILKPDPRAYAAVCEALDMDAGQCIFVDDQRRNIEGGDAAGMRCIHFDVTRPHESYARVRAALGIPEEATC